MELMRTLERGARGDKRKLISHNAIIAGSERNHSYYVAGLRGRLHLVDDRHLSQGAP